MQAPWFQRVVGEDRGAATALVALATAMFVVFLVPGVAGSYGLFIDELYYVACSKRLDFGYVDHPPLAPWLLAASRAIFPAVEWALRLPPALAGALTVFLTGFMARRLGAGAWGQFIAALAAAAAPAYHVLFGFFSMNSVEVLLWVVGAWILVEMVLRDAPRLWLAFGLVAGVGLENKHTMVLFGFAVAVGMLLTPLRRHLRTPWPWAGLALSALLLVPNLAWQVAHDWPTLEFYRNADLNKNVATPPHIVLLLQILFMNPGTLPLWAAGAWWLLFDRDDRRWRHLGWAFVVLLALMLIGQKSRPDRIAGIYPVVFAAGAVLFERFALRGGGWRALSWGFPAWLVVWGIVLAPIGLPILPPPQLARYVAATGIVPQIEAGSGKVAELPQWMADRLGWEQLAADVGAALAQLSPEERANAAAFAPSYGQAGALELYGERYGMPPVYSTHNSYYLWGPPRERFAAAVVVGNTEERLSQWFESVELAVIHDCDYCLRWRDEMPIWIVRRPRESFDIHELWPEWKHFE